MNEANIYRCRICGEVYFGTHPSHCPYCGAHQKYLVGIFGWKDENKGVRPTAQESKDLAETNKLEFHASRIYRAAAAEAEHDYVKGFFKYLAKIEREHYQVTCKILGIESSDEINGLGNDSKGSDKANLEESVRLEEHATKLYREFADHATTPRIQDFFRALADIEADHIELDSEELSKLN